MILLFFPSHFLVSIPSLFMVCSVLGRVREFLLFFIFFIWFVYFLIFLLLFDFFSPVVFSRILRASFPVTSCVLSFVVFVLFN